jgi:hypothetical protein
MNEKFIIGLVILGLLVGVTVIGTCAAGCKGAMTSSGYRDGTIQKFTDKGIFWTTTEGTLATASMGMGTNVDTSTAMSNAWEFSVWDTEVANQLRELPVSSKVRLHYRQHRWVWPWQGSTAYEVWKATQ